ncbi:MAG: AAA family ATPase [Muribaculaceae bacterium]|nr:AAA family ATPase [Muribaculaceae bacterium]
MKLLKIEIHNIASIKDAVIDFENGPLNEESQFLITGKTGSGKTTILDAICLALYDQTPRMKNANRAVYDDADGNKIHDADTRTLMRKNTGEAWSRVTFLDKDDNKVIAQWYVYRANKKVSGKMQDVKHTLEQPDGTIITNKKTETSREIVRRIGLSFDQFCRTSMLAQGEFTKFLRAKDDEKSEILEKLTGLDIYSEIGKKIFAITSEKKSEVTRLELQTNNITPLDDDQIAEKKGELDSLAKTIAEQESLKKSYEQAKQWFESMVQTNQKLEQITQEEQQLKEKIESESFRQVSGIVSDWDKTEEVRRHHTQMTDARNGLAMTEQNDNNAMQSFVNLTGELLSLEADKDLLDQRNTNISRTLAENESKKPVFEKVALIKEHIKTIKANENLQVQLDQECKSLAESIAILENEIAKLHTQFETATQNEQAKQAEIEEKQRAASQFDQDSLAQRRSVLVTTNQVLSELKTDYTRYCDLRDNVAAKEQNIATIKADITVAEEANAKASGSLKQAETKVDEAQSRFDKLKESADDYLKTIRATLHNDDTCPLCGQKIIELTSDAKFEEIVAPLRQELESAKANETAARNEANKCQITLKAKEQALASADKELGTLKAQADAIIAKLNGYTTWADYADSENPLEQISKDIEKNEAEQTDIAAKQKQLSEILTAANKLQAEKDKITSSKTAISNTINTKKQGIAHGSAQKDSKEQNITNARQTVNDNIGKVTAIFGDESWMQAWQQNADEFASQLQRDADNYRAMVEEQASIATRLASISQDINNINGLVNDIASMRPIWAKSAVSRNLQPNLATRFASLLADVRSISDSISRYKDQDKTATAEINRCLSQLENISIERVGELIGIGNNIAEYRAIINDANEANIRINTTKTTLTNERQKLESERPQAVEGETIDSATAKIAEASAIITESHTKQGAISQQLKQDAENKAKLESILKEIEVAKAEYISWERLSSVFGSSDGKKFRAIAQSFILHDMLLKANVYLRQFIPRYEMKGQPGTLAIAIIDHEMADSDRPISNISGGESFLLSLSLALGLSSLSNQAMAMDTLFIDEGFGTLDSEYLSSVINALEQLHNMGGKKVGIISHVDSLKERITTQIQVNCINNSHSEIKVVSTL